MIENLWGHTEKLLLFSFSGNFNVLKVRRIFIGWDLPSGLRFGLAYDLGQEEITDDWFEKLDSFLLYSKITSLSWIF